MRAYQKLRNATKNFPLVDRMEYAVETSCTLKSIVRHHLYMKCGSGFDRTFPDVMMTNMDDEQLEFMRNHPDKVLFHYQVSSAERYKHVNNEMFINGSQDSNSRSPLMACIRSRSATSKRSSERYRDYVKKRQPWITQEYCTRTTTSSEDIRSSGRTTAERFFPGIQESSRSLQRPVQLQRLSHNMSKRGHFQVWVWEVGMRRYTTTTSLLGSIYPLYKW